MEEFIIAVEVQSLKSKVPTDFRFEETKIMLNLNSVVWFKEYWHVATDKFQDSHTEVLIQGTSKPITIVIGYEEFKKKFNNKNN